MGYPEAGGIQEDIVDSRSRRSGSLPYRGEIHPPIYKLYKLIW